MANESQTLIAIATDKGRLSPEQLQELLGLSDKKWSAILAGEPAPRATLKALNAVAEYFSPNGGGMTHDYALNVKVGDVVQHDGEKWTVLSVKKTGANPPYFSLIGPKGPRAGVPYRFTQPLPTKEK